MTTDPMAEIRESFFIECEELLEALHDGLQTMENGEDDDDTINIVFRAVHSIKGGAGAFGLEGLVRFAHRYETALDEVRSDRLEVTKDVLKLFFQAADHLSDLVRVSRDDEQLPAAETAKLLGEFDGFLGQETGAKDPSEAEIEFQPMGLALDLSFGEPDGEQGDHPLPNFDDLPPPPKPGKNLRMFRIRFAPQLELFETGNEPALLLRNLQELGDLSVTCHPSDLPPLERLIPELPHLSWTAVLTTDAQHAEIASVFEFVEGLCLLDISRLDQSEEVVEVEPVDPSEPQISAPDKSAVDAPTPMATEVQPERPRPNETPKKTAASVSASKSVVRVDLDRIERLVNLVGELVINQAMLSQSLERSGLSPHSDAMNGLEEFQRLTRDIQDSVMMIRAQPVKSLFQRMSRIVREASAAVDKDVRLHHTGETTEVDKTVIERLADPLTHMIRNAVDHGLETPEERLAAGKTPQGKVTLSAAHRSGRVVIEVADDGAGINRPKVRQIAIDKGLISSEATLSDAEIDNLLFLPGFSTAAVVSDLSGRGVGMDVVRTAIQALGGRISISSEPGKGTVFTISLPLTLAVLDGMVIEVAGETLVLPLNLVVETMTLSQKEVQMVRPGHHVVEVRSGFVPLFDLGKALGYRREIANFDDSIVLLIAREDESNIALVIDNIVDQRQVVIKGLDDSFHRGPGIAAATILGDGQIALILDPTDIISTPGPVPPPTATALKEGMPA